jgi:multidrug efflux pump subunit AcrA (membrane-fusion protein)
MPKIYTYGELKESKIIYDRKPPAFGVIITFMTLIFLIASVCWAGFSTKTYVVKASGIVASENKINIMNKVSGSIDKINVVEGDTVAKGDVLVEMNSFQTELQITQILTMVDFYSSKVELLERLVLFVNNFRLDNVESRKNPFDNNNASEIKYYSDAQMFIDYVDGQEKAAQEPPEDGDESEPFEQSDVDSVKGQFLSQHYGTLDDAKAQVVQQQGQLKMYADSLVEYKIIAEQDGIVNLSARLTVGTMIQAGALLGTISAADKSILYFDTVISATDRAKIAVGDTVEIAVSGIMQSEYGVLKGKVTEIASNSTQTENGQVFYRVKIKPDTTQLKDKKGNVVDLTTGMLAESRIKYDETTWLKWAIEQIGVKFR